MSTKQTYFQEDWFENVQNSRWLKHKDDKRLHIVQNAKNLLNFQIWETKI